MTYTNRWSTSSAITTITTATTTTPPTSTVAVFAVPALAPAPTRRQRPRTKKCRTSATHSQVPSPTQTHVHPTDDVIEAIIQQATAARSGDSRPLRDTRTQLFVGNVRSVSSILVRCSYSFPFSSPTASAGKTSKTCSERLALSSTPMSLSGPTTAPGVRNCVTRYGGRCRSGSGHVQWIHVADEGVGG